MLSLTLSWMCRKKVSQGWACSTYEPSFIDLWGLLETDARSPSNLRDKEVLWTASTGQSGFSG